MSRLLRRARELQILDRMFRRLLVPVDFGRAADRARDLAVDIAVRFDAKLELVHAFYVPPVVYASTYIAVDTMMEEAHRLLDGALVEVRKRCPHAEALWVDGEPRQRIVELAGERGSDLIVMGTHGRRGVPRVLLGSVAERVVRSSPVPVLTASAAEPKTKPRGPSFRTILVPTDFGEPAEQALAIASTIAAKFDGTVTLVHAYATPATIYDEQAYWPVAKIRHDAELALRRALDDAKKRFGAVDSVLVGGDPREAILEVAKTRGVDLIVMGTHGRRGLARVFLGSVAERVVRTSPIPVLTATR